MIFLILFTVLAVLMNSAAETTKTIVTTAGRKSADMDITPELMKKLKMFSCMKLKSCVPGGRVCAYDYIHSVLKYFDDICVLYTVNCNEIKEFSKVVDKEMCEAKEEFDKSVKPTDTENTFFAFLETTRETMPIYSYKTTPRTIYTTQTVSYTWPQTVKTSWQHVWPPSDPTDQDSLFPFPLRSQRHTRGLVKLVDDTRH